MYQRISLWPILTSHWNSSVVARDLAGKGRFLPFDFAFFYVLPLLFAYGVAAGTASYREVLEFVGKFAILLIPLMLNLFFHVFRLIQDEKKAPLPSPSEARALTDAKNKMAALVELAYHILYSACASFVTAVIAGVASLKSIGTLGRYWIPEATWPLFCFVSAMLVYALAAHVFLVGLQIIRKTYNIVSYVVG